MLTLGHSDRSTAATPAVVVALLAVLATSACGETTSGAAGADAAETDALIGDGSAAGDAAGDAAGSADPAPECDPINEGHCLLPFPSDKFLKPDPSSPTGVRLDLRQAGMPANVDGVRVDPAAWNRMDGYGIGWAALALFPDIDLSALPSETDPSGCLDADAAIVLVEVSEDGTVTRVPYFVELDDDVDIETPQQQVLAVRPLVIPREGTRYAIAFRGIQRTDGTPFAPAPAFKKLRDQTTGDTWLSQRQAHFDKLFATLAKAGVQRSETVLAWDWVTSSHEALHGDMLRVRDEGLKTLGAKGPVLTVKSVEVRSAQEDPRVALRVRGTFRVPHYVTPVTIGGQTGWRLKRGADGKPVQDGWRDADFWLRVPHSALDGSAHGLLQYGHGLLGTGAQLGAGHLDQILADDRRIGFACNWTGMANEDFKPISQMIFDFKDFAIIPERLHQGMLEQLALARGVRERVGELAMAIDQQLDAAGRAKIGLSAALKLQVDPARQHYTGDSQGGIYGATYIALSQEVTRAVLGVPGQNYSLLLRRSVDFVPYFLIMRARYQGVVDRAVMLQIGQVLWDQVDPASYFHHLSADPLPDTPKHAVILGSAKGDWQVALLTNEITVRTPALGIALMPGYGKALWQQPSQPYPHTGSGLVNWDYGNPWPKPGPKPPNDSLGDPHGKPRKDPRYIEQMLHFFKTGVIIDVCGGQPCTKPAGT